MAVKIDQLNADEWLLTDDIEKSLARWDSE